MPQFVPAAHRVLQVFEAFSREKRPMSNSELARQLDLADSSCSDLLYTLREAGYLLRMPKSRSFYPTGRLFGLAESIAGADAQQIIVSEALEMLTKQSGETSMCGYLEGNRISILACCESPRALRYVLRPGTTVDVHATSLGKAILGAMPLAERNALIDALAMDGVTPITVRDKGKLRKEIDADAGRGWYLASDEGTEGVTAIGIAGDINGRLTALSVVGPTRRMRDNLDAYVTVLLETRKELFGE